MSKPLVVVEKVGGHVVVITINRPEVKNCVDEPTAKALADAFRELTSLSSVEPERPSAPALTSVPSPLPTGTPYLNLSDDGPVGPSRMLLSKPVIACVDGYAVAAGLELAVWCDLRVASETAVFGVFCRTKGVPLIDGSTVRLPRLVGQSFALDVILTGRPVTATEAYSRGLVNRLDPAGQSAPQASLDLARLLASHP
ncbi:ClpP/crotonase [Gonapodya prolifera JEL478]|uniref:ClpP/crotonase n=1 Tax=Gonapodya prolifera (strain JEL478) TaxID=1344416 RepID=A0A139AIF8_GONPJ|nr:ClpP/crotonase [Gonapodya prolifera JEL478]|eukprot:KXS16570.1 ClpP/crotonase [Gonapodya prolifera JEL478]